MATLRKPDYRKEEEGVDAFVSEDESLAAIELRSRQAPPRRRWIIAAAMAAVVVVTILIVVRNSGGPPNSEGPGLLPARAMVTPGDARVSPPIIEPRSVATTGTLPEAARDRRESSIGQTLERSPLSAAQPLASAPAATGESAGAMTSAPAVDAFLPPSPNLEPPAVPVTKETVTIVAHARDRSETDNLLRAYAESYNRMDVASMTQVWPTVDTGALSRAFSTLAQQHLAFDSCNVDFASLRATAECAGEVRYVPRVGDPTPRVLRRVWTIEMQRSQERWQISGITVR